MSLFVMLVYSAQLPKWIQLFFDIKIIREDSYFCIRLEIHICSQKQNFPKGGMMDIQNFLFSLRHCLPSQ